MVSRKMNRDVTSANAGILPQHSTHLQIDVPQSLVTCTVKLALNWMRTTARYVSAERAPLLQKKRNVSLLSVLCTANMASLWMTRVVKFVSANLHQSKSHVHQSCVRCTANMVLRRMKMVVMSVGARFLLKQNALPHLVG
jgi:hypothetical protein